jgi:prepilin-type N-terminal cleavage/methylation domain-containing protein
MLIRKASVKKAFTLSELLVSMAVIGLIATLTLPHVFMSVDRAKKRAVFKEAYKALAEATQASMMEGETTSQMIRRLNPKKICETNAKAQGCTQYTDGVEVNEPGVVLSTGVTIFGLASPADTTNGMVIGLEDFPQKEYFFIISNQGDNPFFFTNAEVAGSDYWMGYPMVVPPGDFTLDPGEITCIEQKCVDMFKND